MTISIHQALDFIYEHTPRKSTEIIAIEESLGTVVAKDYLATFDLPRFDNSAMDGYAVKIQDAGKEVEIKEVIYAGDRAEDIFKAGEAVKIMTGAPTPKGCEAIVAIENVEKTQKGVRLPSNIKMNNFIRWKGEDLKAGKSYIKAHTTVTAYTLALLASQGITHIEVYRRPKVVIFSTGDELKAHYEKIEPQQLYNSNAPMFSARAKELGCEVSYISSSADTLESLKEAVKNARDADLILTSGGVSVGDKDFTKQAFMESGMENIFSGIDIKPGKPTNFGKIENCLVINLPGNPLAAMVNFEMFVKPCIAQLSGSQNIYHGIVETKMACEHKFRGGKNTVILGQWDGVNFRPIENQKPGMLSPLAQADGMIVVPQNLNHLSSKQSIKMIAIKLNIMKNKREDFFTQ